MPRRGGNSQVRATTFVLNSKGNSEKKIRKKIVSKIYTAQFRGV